MPFLPETFRRNIAILALALSTSATAVANEAEDGANAETNTSAAEKESPWLITPTVSADPKLGTTLGGVLGYIKALDPGSTPSLLTSFVTYSDTDSYVGGLYGDIYLGANKHRIKTGYINGRIRNEYDDFLGSGISVKTEDNMESFFFRYMHQVKDDWYFGGQVIISDYVVGADGIFDLILGQIGLSGFQSNGLGLVAEFDSRDEPRDPSSGNQFVVHNVAYRESLGGEESFDALKLKYTNYWQFGNQHVLATNVQGRWSKDAPTSGYSSLNMRGYTRGNYLAEHYSHLNLDARFHIRGRWGASLFGGVGCLYEKFSSCDDSDALYPMIGTGIIFDLKPDAGIVLRLEFAKGKSDNEAYYLSLGHPF